MKNIFFMVSLVLLQTGCTAFQRDVKIADEVLQDEEQIVNVLRTKISNNASL